MKVLRQGLRRKEPRTNEGVKGGSVASEGGLCQGRRHKDGLMFLILYF